LHASVHGVLETLLLVSSLGLADSINPVTIVIAIYLASTPSPRTRLVGFALGVFTVYLFSGTALLLGPGELAREALAGMELPGADYVLLASGAVAVLIAWVLWSRRTRWGAAEPAEWALRPKSAFLIGAAATAFDLPTAFPYFGAIAVIAGSGLSLAVQLLLLGLFNVLYVLPLLLLFASHLIFGERAEAVLAGVRATVQRMAWPALSALTLAGACALLWRGASGLIG
jgi:cytochrome c biogenesis protein CcdA